MNSNVLSWRNAINGRDAVSNGTVESASSSAAARSVERTASTSAGRRMLSAYYSGR